MPGIIVSFMDTSVKKKKSHSCPHKAYIPTEDRIKNKWVVGGGIGMGNTCKPMAVSFQCMTKFTTNKKKKALKKINE